MGKPKRGKKGKKPAVSHGSDEEGDHDENAPDPTSDDYFQDEIDTFHADREKILLDSGKSLEPAGFSSDEEEEVLGLSDSDDEEIQAYEEQMRAAELEGKRGEVDSDLEQAQDDDIDEKAWGKKRSKYYGADVSDDEDIDLDEDNDAALLEEKEALAIQRRMAEQLEEDDFGLEIFKQAKKPISTKDVEKQKIVKDLSKLSKKEKIELLKKESPELLDLIQDFKVKMTEVQDKLLPIDTLVREGRLPASSAADYIQRKLTVVLNYCVNINFYLMLKARHTPVHNHPVIARLVQYRNLLKQMEPLDQQIEAEQTSILARIQAGEEFPVLNQAKTSKERQGVTRKMRKKPESRKVSQLQEESATSGEDEDERYNTVIDEQLPSGGRTWGRKRNALETTEDLEFSSRLEEPERDEEEDEQDEEMEDGKRGITYQIEKNKGLTPHRKKEQRNPRVKHRLKYRKAKIRRKGQVREVRTEMDRYGGEISGIRAGVKRGTRLS